MRQLMYGNPSSITLSPGNILPMLGPLHISLNSRECVLLKFHAVFKEMYCALFGEKAILAKKPKPWRISLLLVIMYGGWTLIRDEVVAVFSHSKDVQYLTLLNLVDNYIPVVLSIYSVIFKGNNVDQYFHALLRCWVMLSGGGTMTRQC